MEGCLFAWCAFGYQRRGENLTVGITQLRWRGLGLVNLTALAIRGVLDSLEPCDETGRVAIRDAAGR